MPKLNFVAADGKTWSIDAESGVTVKDIAQEHQIPGIVADCGGSMSCATCHVYVDPGFAGTLRLRDVPRLYFGRVVGQSWSRNRGRSGHARAGDGSQ